MSILTVKNISKVYKDKTVLDDITFSIDQPGIIALVGPNGIGKSTFLNGITNLSPFDRGEVEILGIKNTNHQCFSKTSYLKDNQVLYPYLTAWDHLLYAGRTYHLSKAELLEKANEMGIGGYLNKKVDQFSLGMKQHLLLTLAILNDPEFIIMDEPLTGLDPTSVIAVRELIDKLHLRGKTILMSSHDLSEITELTNHVLFINKGKIQEEFLDYSQLSLWERYIEIYGLHEYMRV